MQLTWASVFACRAMEAPAVTHVLLAATGLYLLLDSVSAPPLVCPCQRGSANTFSQHQPQREILLHRGTLLQACFQVYFVLYVYLERHGNTQCMLISNQLPPVVMPSSDRQGPSLWHACI